MLPVLLLSIFPAQEPAIDVTALFHEHCASCHGETGDGQGWAELDRQARSFKDGGFSFGNTPETILRTVTNGIPGSPMPAFDRALTEEQRKALVQHVIALGPPDMSTEPTNTELVVTDRPLIVRGGLPPIADGLDPRPRGLLLGTLEGLTYEYRTDDVRLLGVRSGAFCDRTDWVGRGGTPLKPLGQVVVLQDGGNPGPIFWAGAVGSGTPLESRLAGTIVVSDDPVVSYWLVHPELGRVALVYEVLRTRSTSVGIGCERLFRIEGQGHDLTLSMSAARGDRSFDDRPSAHPELEPKLVFPQFDDVTPFISTGMFRQTDGRLRWVRVVAPAVPKNATSATIDRSGGRFSLDLTLRIGANESRGLGLVEFLLSEAKPEHIRVLQELPR